MGIVEGDNRPRRPARRSIGHILHPRIDVPVHCKPWYVKWREFFAVMQWVFTFLFLALICLFAFIWVLLTLLTLGIAISTIQLEPLQTKLMRGSISERVGAAVTDIRIQFTLLFLVVYWYLSYWWGDLGKEERGSNRRTFLRDLRVWRYLADYFPIHLVVSDELRQYAKEHVDMDHAGASDVTIDRPLSSGFNYLVGYHPHGVFSTGAFVNFATDATGFSRAFPTLTPWLATLPAHFKVPFYRDYIMSYGVVSASKRSLQYLLDSRFSGKTGNFVVVVLGGAPESLDARPGRYVMHTSYRFGFFKIALQTGAHLIPCVSFGEQSMYKQVSNEPGGKLRRFQEWFCDWSTFAPPLFYARGPFPYRTPVDTVVGAPIPCERVAQPTREQIAALKKVYVDRLQALFHRYKAEYDPDAADVEFV